MTKQTARSLKLSKEGIEKANQALLEFESKSNLATHISTSRKMAKGSSPKTTVGISRTTINSFFKGESVRCREFHEICKKLNLNWQEVADFPQTTRSKSENKPQNTDVDRLVEEVRGFAKTKIKNSHGTMRMLRVNHSVPVDDIYIELNVLKSVSGDRTFSDYRKDFKPEMLDFEEQNFDRLGLEEIQEEDISALEKVQECRRLMVFGKPGAGKTTFLKLLAIQCIDGKLQFNQQDYVPIFIRLNQFAKDIKQQKEALKHEESNLLLSYIYRKEFCS